MRPDPEHLQRSWYEQKRDEALALAAEGRLLEAHLVSDEISAALTEAFAYLKTPDSLLHNPFSKRDRVDHDWLLEFPAIPLPPLEGLPAKPVPPRSRPSDLADRLELRA